MKHVHIRQGTITSTLEVPGPARNITFLQVAAADVDGLIEAAIHYGESWYKRDGAGAFFMLARKWDRIENTLAKKGNYNILTEIQCDMRAEGLIDDVRDLRRYLLLVEAKLLELGTLPGEVAKGDKVAIGGDLHSIEARYVQHVIPGDVVAELEKLRKFKAYVHDYLDKMEVPKCEELECRIGGRLEWVAGQLGKNANADWAHKYEQLASATRDHLRYSKAKVDKRLTALLGEGESCPVRPSVINMQNGVEQAEHPGGPWVPLSPGEPVTMAYVRQECPDLPDSTPATDRD